nr:retrovirus-related Pol polyprotein from transposon TNT 1-94 [Tanacetum cinerariifolium]
MRKHDDGTQRTGNTSETAKTKGTGMTSENSVGETKTVGTLGLKDDMVDIKGALDSARVNTFNDIGESSGGEGDCLSGWISALKKLKKVFMQGEGQVLTALGIDANNGIYPAAYVLVEAKTKNSWCWFLEITRAKFDIEKFDGTGDFGLWRVKMRALLIQHGCEVALNVLPTDMEAQIKAELNKKAHSAMILCLDNKVLREVTGETTAVGVWSKLKTLYMTKSLANKVYLKNKLYTFYMPDGRKISKHIDEFNKIVLDLENIEVKFEDEDLALLLLTSLPALYEHFVDTLLYGREALTLEDSKGKSRSKSRGGRLKCYIFQSEDHLKRNYPKNNRKKSSGYINKDDQPSSSGSIYDGFEIYFLIFWNAMGAGYCWVTIGSARLEGVKGYRLYRLDNESPKIVTCRNMVFNECVMYKDTLKDFGVGADKSVEELQVEVELKRLNNHTLEEDQTGNEDQTDQDDGDDEDARIKEGIEGVQKPRYKARLVAHGFTQRACIDYNELDVKTAFLHGNLKEVIYMRQPPGYEQCNKVCLLKKSLYGLKQSPRSYAPGEYIYQLLYVDDMLIACKSKAEIGSTKSLLKREFDKKDLGEAKKILGMEIVRDQSRKILRVSQSGYISMILNNFRIDNRKSVQMPLGGHFKLSLKDCPIRDYDVERMSKVPYVNAVGSLMYLMVCTRPYISYAVSIVADIWQIRLKILGSSEMDFEIFAGYCKRGIGMCCKLEGNATTRGGSFNYRGGVYALTEAAKEAIWIKGLLEELGVELNRVTVNCDNQGTIHLSRNHVFHERTKHINVRYHFIIEVLEAKTVEVLKVGTEHNVVDALTKVTTTPTATRILDSIKKEEAFMTCLVEWLSTWKEVYSHTVQPMNVSNSWVKSSCPTTILPPNYRVPIERPKKKRARSLCDEDEIVKNGKLSKKRRTVTCQSCGHLGQNKLTFKGYEKLSSNGARTSGGVFGNKRQSSGSQIVVSQADLMGS